jgi:N-acyl-D-amino-acid deacylase
LTTKGRIAPGYDGDLCIFDPNTIQDTADYVNCASPNIGIHYVLIGGQVVVEDGKYNGTRAGKLHIRSR